jgi:hypothetical protein
MGDEQSKSVLTTGSLNELGTALAIAQAEVKNAVRGETNPEFHSSYADLAAVWDACRQALSKNGLSVLQFTGISAEGAPVLFTTLLHRSGQAITGTTPIYLPPTERVNKEGKTIQTNMSQAFGSAITYARRYALAAMVGVATEDDDANSANGDEQKAKTHSQQPSKPDDAATEAQKGKIVAMAKTVGYKSDKMAAFFAENKMAWDELTKAQASHAIDLLSKIEKAGKDVADKQEGAS